MKTSRFFSAFIFLTCIVFSGAAQENTVGLDANVLYNRETVGAIQINSSGFGAAFKQTKIKDAFKSTFFEFNFSTYRDFKEEKVYAISYVGYSSFKYAKLNEIFFLRGGYGNLYRITRKPFWGGVELQLSYSFGANICFALPIFLYIEKGVFPNYSDIVLEKYDPSVHLAYNIVGGGPYFAGITELKVYPGIYGNIGFYFEYGQYNNVVKAIEIGGTVNLFPIGVPVMAYNDPKNIFFSFYLNVIFGKRYNK